MVSDDRSVRRRRPANQTDRAVSRRSCGAGAGLRCGACAAQRPAAAPGTAMGSVLAGMSCMGSAAAGRVLVDAAACLPPRDTLAQRVEDAGGLSTGRSGQRVAVAPAMV